MNGAERAAADDPVVGVVGAGDDAVARIERAVGVADDEEADRVSVVSAADVAPLLERNPTFVAAVGEAALTALVRADVPVPILPIETGDGLESVPDGALGAAVESVLAGESSVVERPVLTVETDDYADRALFDVTLVTGEPAHISEYAVRTADRDIARFRADGVVAATPAGSAGYASAAGGPVLSHAIDAVAVVPIAPFVTQTDQWILPDDDVRISVERDECPVVLVVDDRPVGPVPPGDPVSITAADSIDILRTDVSEDPRA